MTAIVLYIPHASRCVSSYARKDLLVDDATLERELLCMTDAWTDTLVDGFRLRTVPRADLLLAHDVATVLTDRGQHLVGDPPRASGWSGSGSRGPSR